jgi:hypothetical protein
MYKQLIREQINRIVKARSKIEGYDYYESVESLIMILPEDIESKAIQYRDTHKDMTTIGDIDGYFNHIKWLIKNSMCLDGVV